VGLLGGRERSRTHARKELSSLGEWEGICW
jgi:hypothetical protein